MAFVVVLFRGEELTRREVAGPLVIGRAPDCDISVRDILLSRRHCQIVPVDGGGWVVEDLGSKNGTRVKGEAVGRAALPDGASIRIGKTQLKFYTGKFRPAVTEHRPNSGPANGTSRRRPADPFEALSGTVSAFEYKPEHPERDLSRLPSPRPKPSDPASYADEDVYSMLTEIVSSSWDSIYATASGPAAVRVEGQQPSPQPPAKRRAPAAGATVAGQSLPPRSRHVPADPSLQVFFPDPPPEPEPLPGAPARPAPAGARRRWRNSMSAVLRGTWNVLTGRSLRRTG
jgi:hypothetical protein